jgi:translation initiation factor RLI1
MPRPGQVLGLVGTNGIGKSTALKILSGKLKPNLGRYDNPPDWEEILRYFRGSELQSMSPCLASLGTILADFLKIKITLPRSLKTISKL